MAAGKKLFLNWDAWEHLYMDRKLEDIKAADLCVCALLKGKVKLKLDLMTHFLSSDANVQFLKGLLQHLLSF